jgi:Holliday junction resolvase RusA-like endonuclease
MSSDRAVTTANPDLRRGALTLSIVVLHKPVSVNQAYGRAKFSAARGKGGGKGLFLTKVGREFKDAIRSHALAARMRQEWPKPEHVLDVAVAIRSMNCPRHDADSPCKLVLDSLQRIVYENDRVVSRVTASKGKDGGKPRVEIVVELLRAL